MKNKSSSAKTNRSLPTLLIRSLFLVTATLLFTYFCTRLLFSALGLNAYADIQMKNMLEQADHISTISASFLEGKTTREHLIHMLGQDNNIWDSSLYLYDSNSTLVIRTADKNTEYHRSITAQYLKEVLSGKSVENNDIVLVGKPISGSDNKTIGAVFMIKPVSELEGAMTKVRSALTLSVLLSFAVMTIPVYFMATKGISAPIRRVTETAEEMASGKYSATALPSQGRSEIATLDRSLHTLWDSLSKTIDELNAEKNILHEILGGMADGLLAFNIDENIIQYNPAAVKLLNGIDSIPEDSEIICTMREKMQALHRQNSAPLHYFAQCNGIILSIRICYVFSPENDSSLNDIILVLLHDSTEAARYEQSRKDYVANVSHELRTPIANIKSISEAFCDDMIPTSETHKYYEHLYKESSRLSRLINDLLELSRMQSGNATIEKTHVSVQEMLYTIKERFSRMANEKGVEICSECNAAYYGLYQQG